MSETITDEDVVEIDAVAFRVVTNIRRMEADDQISANDFEEILSMTFSATGSDGLEVTSFGQKSPLNIQFYLATIRLTLFLMAPEFLSP